MPGDLLRPPENEPGPGSVQELDPLLDAQHELRSQLAAALRRHRASGRDEAAARAAEKEVARLVGVLQDAWLTLGSEAHYLGIAPATVEARYLERHRTKGPLGAGEILLAALPSEDDAALAPWRASAEAGSVPARYVLGNRLVMEESRPDSIREGLDLLEQAADLGHPHARFLVARLVLDSAKPGNLVPLAIGHLEEAARSGHGPSAYLLAMAAGEVGVSPDPVLARQRLEAAAEAGHSEAMLLLGHIHARGTEGSPPDRDRAVAMMERAAGAHRSVARRWLRDHAHLSPEEFASRIHYENWTPSALPPPAPSGPVSRLLAFGFLALLVAALFKGSGAAQFVLLAFIAVVLHEAGHFLGARLSGIPILQFNVGVGPLLKAVDSRSLGLPMRYEFRLLPLLGYVRPWAVPPGVFALWAHVREARRTGREDPPLVGLDPAEEPRPASRLVPPRRRFPYTVGGLAVNLLLGFLFLFLHEHVSTEARLFTVPVLGHVPPASVAHANGLRSGDRILAVDGVPVTSFPAVQRRLAPAERDGRAAVPPDAPGTTLSILVRRDGEERLVPWVVPASPPPGYARYRWGLVPAETWFVRRVARGAGGLLPGDELLSITVDGRETPVQAPGARDLLEERLSRPDGGPVTLLVRRNGEELRPVLEGVVPAAEKDAPSARSVPPFELERLRETGPAQGPVDTLVASLRMGATVVVALPEILLGSLAGSPDEGETWEHQAPRKDPWEFLRMFAFLNSFLFFLNLLPVPPLDGFHLLCDLTEAVRGRPLSTEFEGRLLKAGWILMAAWILLNGFLLLRDLGKDVF